MQLNIFDVCDVTGVVYTSCVSHIKDHAMLPANYFHGVTGLLNGDVGDTDSSQETFEVSGSMRIKMSGMNCMSSRNKGLCM